MCFYFFNSYKHCEFNTHFIQILVWMICSTYRSRAANIGWELEWEMRGAVRCQPIKSGMSQKSWWAGVPFVHHKPLTSKKKLKNCVRDSYITVRAWECGELKCASLTVNVWELAALQKGSNFDAQFECQCAMFVLLLEMAKVLRVDGIKHTDGRHRHSRTHHQLVICCACTSSALFRQSSARCETALAPWSLRTHGLVRSMLCKQLQYPWRGPGRDRWNPVPRNFYP